MAKFYVDTENNENISNDWVFVDEDNKNDTNLNDVVVRRRQNNQTSTLSTDDFKRNLSLLSIQSMSLEELKQIDPEHADMIYSLFNEPNLEKKRKEKKEDYERKIFDILKRVPVLGQAYRVGRAIANKIKNNDEEVTYSLTVDVANLNPVRIVTGIGRALGNLNHDYDDGIWIGKRSLAKCKIGFTISPYVDLYHYAIMIRGIVYHVQGDLTQFYIEKSSDRNLKLSFEWSFITNNIFKTDKEINREIVNFDYFNYSVVPKINDETNCQSFVGYILAFATGWDDDTIESKLKITLGTIFV